MLGGRSESELSDLDHRRMYRIKCIVDGLRVIHSMSTRFPRAVEYRTSQLKNKFSKNDHIVSKNIRKKLTCMTAQMSPNTFDRFDPLSIIGFRSSFKFAFGINEIHEGAAMWLFYFFVKKLTFSALHTRLASEHNARTIITSRGITTTTSTYLKIVKYFLRT